MFHEQKRICMNRLLADNHNGEVFTLESSSLRRSRAFQF